MTPQHLIVAGIVCVAAISFGYHIPRDGGDDAVATGLASLLINQAWVTGQPAEKIFDEAQSSHQGGYFRNSLGLFTFGTPLWQALLCITFALAGVSHVSSFILASTIGVLCVLFTFFLAAEMYGKVEGIFAAIFLSLSLFFIIMTRSVAGFYPLSALNVLMTLYFFYRAQRTQESKHYWIAGVILGLAFFNGYSQVWVLLPILALYWCWESRFPFLLLGTSPISVRKIFENTRAFVIKVSFHYLLAVAIAATVFLVLTLLWDLYLQAPLLKTASYVLSVRASNIGFFTASSSADKLASVQAFFHNMFIGLPPTIWGAHTNLVFLRHPMVQPLVAGVFVIGLVVCLRLRTAADKLCLSWLFVSFIAVTLLAGFQNRAFTFAMPVIYLIAARGLGKVHESISKFSARRSWGPLVLTHIHHMQHENRFL